MIRKSLCDALHMMGKMADVIRDTHGNLSVVDRRDDVMWIKPSGVPYADISRPDVCGITIANGVLLSSHYSLKPSVDTPHHLSIYRRHPWIGAICHTHSPYVVAHAVAMSRIECVTTEHADYFGESVPVLQYRDLDSWGDHVVLDRHRRAVVLGSHGALTFADDPMTAVQLAVALENIAQKNALAANLAMCGGGRRFSEMNPAEIDKWHSRYTKKYGQGEP